MAISAETTRPEDYREHALEGYIESEVELGGGEDSYTRSLRSLVRFFSNEALPILDNLELTNRILRLRKAPAIKERASMKPIVAVPDIGDDLDRQKGNNFMPNFILKDGGNGSKLTSLSHDELAALIHRGDIEAAGLGALEIEDLRPEPVSPDELDLWYKGELNFNRYGNHSKRPAFKRMYALFPEFTVGFVEKINSLPREQWHLVEAHAYVAYCIMSELVDRDDEDVSQNGIVNPDHLTT